MKRLIVLLLFVFVATLGWKVGSQLSADALGMAVGVVFGVMASVPTALLVLAAGRRADAYRGGDRRRSQRTEQAQQSPVVIVAGSPMPMQQGRSLPGGQVNPTAMPYYSGQGYGGQEAVNVPTQRKFRVVGEQDEWVDEW